MNIRDSGNVARLQAIYAKIARIAAQMNDPCLAQKFNSNPGGEALVVGNNTRSNLIRLVDVIAQRRDAAHHVTAGEADRPDVPGDLIMPLFGPRMVCTKCGMIGADVRPNWRERGT